MGFIAFAILIFDLKWSLNCDFGEHQKWRTFSNTSTCMQKSVYFMASAKEIVSLKIFAIRWKLAINVESIVAIETIKLTCM